MGTDQEPSSTGAGVGSGVESFDGIGGCPRSASHSLKDLTVTSRDLTIGSMDLTKGSSGFAPGLLAADSATGVMDLAIASTVLMADSSAIVSMLLGTR